VYSPFKELLNDFLNERLSPVKITISFTSSQYIKEQERIFKEFKKHPYFKNIDILIY
jgi:hypothetical protein